MENIDKIMLHKLKDVGVAYVHIEYSGGGDSGCIDCTTALNSEQEFINIHELPNHTELQNILLNIADYFEGCILNTIEDWWNDHGGFGELILDLSDLSYNIDNHINYTQTELYEHEGNILEKIKDI